MMAYRAAFTDSASAATKGRIDFAILPTEPKLEEEEFHFAAE